MSITTASEYAFRAHKVGDVVSYKDNKWVVVDELEDGRWVVQPFTIEGPCVIEKLSLQEDGVVANCLAPVPLGDEMRIDSWYPETRWVVLVAGTTRALIDVVDTTENKPSIHFTEDGIPDESSSYTQDSLLWACPGCNQINGMYSNFYGLDEDCWNCQEPRGW